MYFVSFKIIKFEMRMCNSVFDMVYDIFLNVWNVIFQILIYELKKLFMLLSFWIVNIGVEVDIFVKVGL